VKIARLIRAMGMAAAFAWMLVAARPAAADDLPDWFTLTPPGGWTYLDERSEAITKSLRMESQLGTMSFQARASVWASAPPPSTAGAALLVSWIATTDPVADAGAAVQAQLERVRTIPDRASLTPGRTTFDEWKKTVDQGVAYAFLAWRHLDDQTESILRTAIIQTASGELRQVSAECVRSTGSTGSDDQAWQRCRRAQGSLAITLGEGQRRSLDTADQQAAPGLGVPPAAGLGAGTTLRLTDPGPLAGSEVPPIAVARAEQTNYRLWLYFVGALLVLIGVYSPFRSQLRSRARADEDQWEEDSELHRVVRRAKSQSGIDSGAAKEKE
jgi:hypothetical protein